MESAQRYRLFCGVLVVIAGGCAGERASGLRGEWTAAIDTVGDTVTVRSLGGSVWGDTAMLVAKMRIGAFEGPDEYLLGNVEAMAVSASGETYLMDTYVPALRKYGPDGAFVGTFGREGGGPGEYKNPDGGLAVLPDGRVLLRDPGNGRFNVYTAEGEYLDGWRLPGGGGFNTGRRLYTDTAGASYTMILLEVGKAPWEWTYGLGRYSPDGTHSDTILAPVWDYERPAVTGQAERSSSMTGVPFTASPSWAFSPLGYMVGGLSTDYRIDLYRTDEPVLRIEKDWIPVPVAAEEAEEQERRIRESFGRRFPGWDWNGPPIPETKPAYDDLFVGDDGRIWVQVSREGFPAVSVEEAREEERRSGRPQIRYRSPVAFDVFDPEGRFLGHVRTPDEFRTDPAPVFRGEDVWAVARDDLDVMYVVRYRLTFPST
jgi:hypothetical protein